MKYDDFAKPTFGLYIRKFLAAAGLLMAVSILPGNQSPNEAARSIGISNVEFVLFSLAGLSILLLVGKWIIEGEWLQVGIDVRNLVVASVLGALLGEALPPVSAEFDNLWVTISSAIIAIRFGDIVSGSALFSRLHVELMQRQSILPDMRKTFHDGNFTRTPRTDALEILTLAAIEATDNRKVEYGLVNALMLAAMEHGDENEIRAVAGLVRHLSKNA